MTSTIAHNLMIAFWTVLGAYFIYGARRAAMTQSQEANVHRLGRLAVMALAFTLIFSHWLSIGPFALRFVPKSVAVNVIRLVTVASGVAFTIWSRHCLGRYWSDNVALKVDHQLVQSGPYKYIRHPLYSGILLALLGSALVVGEGRGLIALSLVLISFWRKARREDALLARQFGTTYIHYRQQAGLFLPQPFRPEKADNSRVLQPKAPQSSEAWVGRVPK